MTNTYHKGKLKAPPGSVEHCATLRLSTNDYARLLKIKATYRDLLGRGVSNAVVFHRALAVLETNLSHLIANTSKQNAAAREWLLIEQR